MTFKYTKIYICLFFIMSLALTGCTSQQYNETYKNEVTINRIVSTAPSLTEILVDIGAADKLVLIDEWSVGIEGVEPTLPYMNFFDGADLETIIMMEPDLFIIEGMLGDPYRFRQIEEAGIKVISIPPALNFSDIYKNIRTLAQVTNTVEAGEQVIYEMEREIQRIKYITNSIPIEERKTVYVEISPAPSIWTTGSKTFIHEMLTIAGGINIFEDIEDFANVSEEYIIYRSPEVILTTMSTVNEPLQEIKERQNWGTIAAIQNNNVYQLTSDYTSRPSTRSVKGVVEMSKALYPHKH
jgi:iron complex transport system substrate-binding protein